MRVLGVIPARYNSSRMPGKPLSDICGKPMIWWVYRQAKQSAYLSEVIVATDDERILSVCETLGMNTVMTEKGYDTPTSRLYEISTRMDADLYLLIMGDEPLVDFHCFDLIIPSSCPDYYVAALTNQLDNPTEVVDFSNQKVVTNRNGEALMISRSPIPYPKGTLSFIYEKVTGVQIFSKKALDFYNRTSKSVLEQAEENDLMRFIENGIPVKMIQSPYKTVSVDTPKDLDVVNEIIKEEMMQNGSL